MPVSKNIYIFHLIIFIYTKALTQFFARIPSHDIKLMTLSSTSKKLQETAMECQTLNNFSTEEKTLAKIFEPNDLLFSR